MKTRVASRVALSFLWGLVIATSIWGIAFTQSSNPDWAWMVGIVSVIAVFSSVYNLLGIWSE